MPFRDIAGDKTETKRLGEVDPEDLRIVVGVAVHRPGEDFDLIQARLRNPFEEIFDVPVAALPGIRVRLFVETEEFVIKDLFM